jgi:predicted ATP-grasp superfamily ATP-dependent carboligase
MKALVTTCTRNSGLTVMRALAAAGWSVCGADDRAFAFGLRSRTAVAPYCLLPSREDPRFVSGLLALLEQWRPDVLFPPRAVEATCRARDAVMARTRCLLPSYGAFEILNDKARLLERCGALGIPAPRVFRLDEAARSLDEAPGSRLVVKPRRDVGGGAGVHFVSDSTALLAAHSSVLARHGAALITEYIPGPTENLRAVHLLFDADSRLVAFFVLRKLRIWPPRVGGTVAGVSTHETEIVERLLPLFRDLNWQGPADAELKIDERDGKAKIMEINPRFSGIIHFPIGCGVNMPLLYCRAALGERLEQAGAPAYPAGVHYLVAARWLTGVMTEIRESGSKWPAVLRHAWQDELRRPRVRSVHACTDPAPILGKLLMALSHD